jgi:hypothetical protein
LHTFSLGLNHRSFGYAQRQKSPHLCGEKMHIRTPLSLE